MPQRTTVTILSPTLSSNPVGRTHVLVELLEDRFDVQVIGFDVPGALWPPLQGADFRAESVFAKGIAGFLLRAAREAARKVRGQVLYCVKPRLTSYGLGLLLRRSLRLPLILDIDDWERGFLVPSPYWEMRHFKTAWIRSPESPLYTRLLDGHTSAANAVTVSNAFLQGMYGGTWIPHARNEALFTPGPMPLRPSVTFLGTPRDHKGIQDLLTAWRQMGTSHAILRLIGFGEAHPASLESDPTIEVRGSVGIREVPALLNQTSIVVVPQRNARASLGQLPAKLMDAIAMGRAVVATDVGDAHRWLSDGAGICVPPGDVDALARALRDLITTPSRTESYGAAARQRFLEFGSFAAVRPRLHALVDCVLAGSEVPPPVAAFTSAARVRPLPAY